MAMTVRLNRSGVRSRLARRGFSSGPHSISLAGAGLALALTLSSCGSHAALTPPELLNAGITAFTQGNDSQARADYQKVIKHDPKNTYGLDKIAWYDLGVLDQKLGNTSSARSEYQQALLIDPKYTNALYNLAVLETPTNPSNAIALYREDLAISPKDPNIRWNLGLLLYKSGNVAAGRAFLKSAIRIDPSIAVKLPKDVKL
ncbi:MAG: tetratricopeptide repeat protein [Acidimicrobiales bacterium]